MCVRVRCALFLWVVSLCILGCGAHVERAAAPRQAFDVPQYEWGKAAPQTLRVWMREHDSERLYMQRAFDRFEAQTKHRLHIVTFSDAKFEDAVARAFAGNGERPDVLVSYGGTNVEAFDPDANFYDFTRAAWVDDLTATSINQTIYHGKVIGLPHWEASISGTLYNKKLFARYGIAPPRTQSAFLSACETLQRHGVVPVYLPYREPTMMLYQFPMDAAVGDARMLEALNAGRLRYADLPAMRSIVQWYHSMAAQGYFGARYVDNDWAGMDEALASERYAMMLCWDTWLYTNFSGNAADFGLMPAFMGVPEEGTFEGPNLALTIVNKKSPRLDAAIDLVTFMADPYNYNAAFAGIYTAPVFKNQVASISTPQYVEAEAWIDRNYRDSTAWLRIRGFAQQDAYCIQKYMQKMPGYTLENCLAEMDALRERRAFGAPGDR